MFYSNDTGTFDTPFFVPMDKEAPDGITLRVVAADTAAGNFALSEAHYAVLAEQLRSQLR
jgi:hypothetical protein